MVGSIGLPALIQPQRIRSRRSRSESLNPLKHNSRLVESEWPLPRPARRWRPSAGLRPRITARAAMSRGHFFMYRLRWTRLSHIRRSQTRRKLAAGGSGESGSPGPGPTAYGCRSASHCRASSGRVLCTAPSNRRGPCFLSAIEPIWQTSHLSSTHSTVPQAIPPCRNGKGTPGTLRFFSAVRHSI